MAVDPVSHWVAVVCAVEVEPGAVAIGEPHKFDELSWFGLDDLPAPLHSQLSATLELFRGTLAGELFRGTLPAATSNRL